MPNKKESSEILLDKIIHGIENVKGEDIQKMDLRKIENTPCEFFVICSGNSNTQVTILTFKTYLLGLFVGSKYAKHLPLEIKNTFW